MKNTLIGILALSSLLLTGCGINETDARVASRNLSQAADMFELERQIVFYNTWQDKYLLVIQGRCSIEPGSVRIAVTCKTGPSEFKKHFLGNSGHVTYFAEQLQSAEASVYHYRVILKPQTVIPNLDLETSLNGDENAEEKDH